jgi:hypothetical protein
MRLTNPPRDSLSEIRRLVRRHDTLLREIAYNTRRTRRTHAPDAPLSILDKHIEETGFESLILSTKVYSNAFTEALKPDTHDDESDDARTIIETQSVNHMTTPETPMVTVVTGGVAEAQTLAIDAPNIGSSIQNLVVIDIKAQACNDYIACSDEELSLEFGDWMNSPKQLTKSRYHGSVDGAWGCFDRKMVIFCFALGSPLQTRTVNTVRNPSNGNYLTCKHGDSLSITVSIKNPSFAVISNPKPDDRA